ncbi:hypothetical protein IWQ62_004829 [Dispira parvispora]|uniref:RWD domain-containing protein n=1 Tax=Dispira parvispora TaxID=1520584 RepID=A0A9W8E5T1_9FUNG|nr:hypothetical protein IWQ62_004829 [Dispira parvispora]
MEDSNLTADRMCELALLRTMYNGNEWIWVHSDPDIINDWQEAVNQVMENPEAAALVEHSNHQFRFRLNLTEIGLSRQPPVYLEIYVPTQYPRTYPQVQVEGIPWTREEHREFSQFVDEQCEKYKGQTCLVALIEDVTEWLTARIDKYNDMAVSGEKPKEPPTPSNAPVRTLTCVVLWMHHLLSTTKRKQICQWALDLDLFGISKPGYPGVLIAEGPTDAINEYVRRLKALRWQALVVRWEDTVPVPPEYTNMEDAYRIAPVLGQRGVREVESMSQASELMARAGLKHAFLTALKISKSCGD